MRPLTLDDSVRVSADVVHRLIGEETVLLNLETGHYYGLDPVGSRIWELLSEHGSLATAFETLSAEFEVAPEQLRQDLILLTQELCDKRLVEPLA